MVESGVFPLFVILNREEKGKNEVIKMSRKIIDVVKKTAKNYLDENELELVKVDFVKEGPHRYLRILLDKEGGIALKDCQEFSRFLNKNLNDNIINDKYFLEVSSPGVERELYNEKDYQKFIGDMVDISLYTTIKGRKKVTGTLKGFTDSVFQIDIKDEDEYIELPRNKVSKINLHMDF